MPADYDCTSCTNKQKWGFHYSSAHDTQGLPQHRCASGDAAYASWVFKLGKWIDNHMPRDTSTSPTSMGYKFDWYHPTADAALSTANCATTQMRVGWWDDSNKIKSVQVLLNDNAASPLYFQQWPDPQHPLANGATLVNLSGVSALDWITVEVRDHKDNRQVYKKRVEQMVGECAAP